MKLLQINSVVGKGSTGKIAESIGKAAIQAGWESYIAYGRGKHPSSESGLIRIGTSIDVAFHGLQTRFLDRHGLASKNATQRLISDIDRLSPDIIHLHNIHGYYLNYPLFFSFLKEWGGKVVWTLHDCWPFTGHCTFPDYTSCDKWETACYHCEQTNFYPISNIRDRSCKNYRDKKFFFSKPLNQLILVPVSNWLADVAKRSYLSEAKSIVIHNGIDTTLFTPKDIIKKKLVLGVAHSMNDFKGLSDFIKLRQILPDSFEIMLVGLTKKLIESLPKGITGLERTANQQQLVSLYSEASVFVNPTYGDNFPTTNLEALACGTPVATYRTGGSPEAIDSLTGRVVERGDVRALGDAIVELMAIPPKKIAKDCRERAVRLFDQRDRFAEYIDLYNSLLGN